MKYKFMGGSALLLAASIALAACGGSVSATNNPSAEKTGVQTASTLSETEAMSIAAAETSTVFTEAFSSRDLAGTWDAATAIKITLNGASAVSANSGGAVNISGSTVTITAAGTYLLTGTLDNGTVIVDAGSEDKVQLVLDGVTIHSDTFAAIYVRQADKVFLTLADGTVNTLSGGDTFTAIDDNNVDGVVFSKDDLTLNGTGKLVVNSPAKHGVVSKDDLVVTGGTYEITAASHALSGKDSVNIADGTFTLTALKDGIHSENSEDAERGNVYIAGGTLAIQAISDGISASGTLQIDGGTLDINGSEGLDGTCIRVNDGTINIYATDDGINAVRKSSAYTPSIEINGGDITVEVGPGDTDGIDANGNLTITGGTVRVTGNSTFDIDGTVTFTGGTVYVNGRQVDTIPRQTMGGRGGMGGMGRGQMPAGEAGQGGMIGRGGRQFPSQSGDAAVPSDGTTVPGNGTTVPGGDGTVLPGRGGKRGFPRNGDGTVSPDGGTIRGGRGQKGQSRTLDAVTSATEKPEAV